LIKGFYYIAQLKLDLSEGLETHAGLALFMGYRGICIWAESSALPLVNQASSASSEGVRASSILLAGKRAGNEDLRGISSEWWPDKSTGSQDSFWQESTSSLALGS